MTDTPPTTHPPANATAQATNRLRNSLDKQREHGRELRCVGTPGGRERQHRSRHQRTDRSLWPDHQLARGPQHRVSNRREQERVQAVYRRQAGKLGIRHRRWHRQRRNRDARHQLAPGAPRVIAPQLADERYRPVHERSLRRRLKRRDIIRVGVISHRRLAPRSRTCRSRPVPSLIERMDRECDGESKCRHDADPLASVLVCLGHHRVREHRQDRSGREGKHERHDVR